MPDPNELPADDILVDEEYDEFDDDLDDTPESSDTDFTTNGIGETLDDIWGELL